MDLTRREFLGYVRDTTLSTASLVVAGEFLNKYSDQKAIGRRIPEDNSGVKAFAEDILKTSARMAELSPIATKIEMALGYWVGFLSAKSFLNDALDEEKRKSSLAALILARAIDIGSTVVVARKLSDPRFKEYGFDGLAFERSPLSPPNPTVTDVLMYGGAVTTVVLPIIWNFRAFDGVSVGYLGSSPFIAKNNLDIAYVISKSLELGDKIKSLLNSGTQDEAIRSYLSSLIPNKNIASGQQE